MFFHRRISIIATAFFAVNPFISNALLAESSPRVSTTSGILNGLSKNNITAFLGIPYAQPPVGDLRWKTALPLSNASGTTEVDATQFGAGCVQLSLPGYGTAFEDANLLPPPHTQSEDCLTLNIWAPRNAAKVPVIIFVHGGAYQTGSSDAPIYYGDHIASTGRAIFVSLNYRLNIWGFPSTAPIDVIDQNIGITDVRLAIEWVAQNIAQFGGDPAQITLTGQSAGASLGEALQYAFEEDPIVVGHIASSGALGTVNTTSPDGDVWNYVANDLGCGNITSASQVSCMRNVSFENIRDTAVRLVVYFGPTADGTLIFTNEEYLARGANGSFAHIPALITSVNNEGSLFVEPYSVIGTNADDISNSIICPQAIEAVDKRQAHIPAWRARYLAQWPNLTPFPNDSSVGAYHGSDIPIYLGTYGDLHIGNGTATKDEQLLSSRYMNAWLTFAENPDDGLSKRLGWPLYDPNGKTLIKIGEHNTSSITFRNSTQYDSTCSK